MKNLGLSIRSEAIRLKGILTINLYLKFNLFFIIAVLAIVTLDVNARQIRIFPVAADPTGTCAVPIPSACDLVRAAAGFAPLTGPDAGIAPQPGDELVLASGTYALVDFVAGPIDGSGPVVIPGTGVPPFVTVMEGLEIRSRDGREVTVIDAIAPGLGADCPFPAVIIGANNVRFGGDLPYQGMTVQNSCDNGIQIGTPRLNPYLFDLSPADQGREDIVVQNNFIFFNGDDGIDINFNLPSVPKSVENLRILYNIIRNNGDDGIDVNGRIVGLGGSSEDEAIQILHNTFDGNDDGIIFNNTGNQEQLFIEHNYFVRNNDDGVEWSTSVLNLENISFSYNLVMENSDFGVFISNSGKIEEMRFEHNRNAAGTQGITGNGSSGIYFFNAASRNRAITRGVQDIEDLLFYDNVINANGIDTATDIQIRFGGFFPSPPFISPIRHKPFDGVTFHHGGNLIGLVFQHNQVRLNAGSGVSIGRPGNSTCFFPAPRPRCYRGYALPGKLEDSIIENNQFWNNGTFGGPGLAPRLFPHGDGFAAFVANKIEELTFRNNESIENYNHGIFLTSTEDDITKIHFYGNLLNKNGHRRIVPGRPPSDGLEISSFGDISYITWDGGEANNNGGSGINLDANNTTLSSRAYGFFPRPPRPPNAIFQPVTPADIQHISITNTTLSGNGNGTPIGGGNGLIAVADRISRILIQNVQGNQNDDHGLSFNSSDDMNDFTVLDSTFEGNDRNHDSVGSGIFFDSIDDMDDISIENVIANHNHIGIQFEVKGENGRNLSVTNTTAYSNDEEGILVNGVDDLSNVDLSGNTLKYNSIGITLKAVDRGSNLNITDNTITGKDGTGVGIQLQAIGATVTNNSIRNNRVGVEARRSQGSVLNHNNIARNEDFGVDALGLKPDEVLDATNNWWGEPSGPKSPANPNGLGDRVSGKVNSKPWLNEPAVETDVNFQITHFAITPSPVNLGEALTITATIRNNGTEEGTQNLSLHITGNGFVEQNTVSRTLNPATEVEVTFNVVLPHSGTFELELSTQNDIQAGTIEVIGAAGMTIELLCAANDDNRIDDDEILAYIGFWLRNEQLPDSGEVVSDAKIMLLIELWVTNDSISPQPGCPPATGPMPS